MTEYFVRTISFPAPFVGDDSNEYIIEDTAQLAMDTAILNYTHPCGLYYVAVFKNADAWHKKRAPLVKKYTDKAIKWQKERGYDK